MEQKGTRRIETERLVLRRFTLDDAETMNKNWASDTEVVKYLTWPAHSSVEISKKVIQSWLENYDKDNYYEWCIELKTIEEAIGSIGVVHTNEDIGSVEFGYCIGRNFWNQGITSEALSALIKFFFEEVKINRIEARHDPENPNSGKVMEKCGLRYEGTRRKADKNNRGICDVSLYGMLAEDYFHSK